MIVKKTTDKEFSFGYNTNILNVLPFKAFKSTQRLWLLKISIFFFFSFILLSVLSFSFCFPSFPSLLFDFYIYFLFCSVNNFTNILELHTRIKQLKNGETTTTYNLWKMCWGFCFIYHQIFHCKTKT